MYSNRTYDPATGAIVFDAQPSPLATPTWNPGNVETEDPHNQPFTTLEGADGEEDAADDDLIDTIGDDDIDGIGDDPTDPCDGPATNIVTNAGPFSRSRSQPVNWI
jgi:hypothetical protein